MQNEGMGRRFSRKDVAHDLEEQRYDAVDAAFDRLKAQVIKDLLSVDQKGKALTGRKAEQYEDESGIIKTELFPEGAHILNIGDPWQVLDKEGVVNLEYETGEEADFVYDSERFLNSVLEELEEMQGGVENMRPYDASFASELAWRVNAVKEHVQSGIKPEDYPKQSKILYDITRIIGEHYGNDDSHGASREWWYAAMRLARGFEDVYYVKTVINPAIEKEIVQKRGISEEEREVLVRRLIGEFRGKKKYKHAEMVKGAFPDTPFMDHSFDRIIASWSISAHMFGVINKGQFAVVWKELDRILKQNGAAYIWPLDYWTGLGGNEMAMTLREHRAKGGDAGCIFLDVTADPRIEWIDDVKDDSDLAYNLTRSQTLVFLPRGFKREAKKRVAQSLHQTKVV
ncbi:MAG: class I SAM-dependent methyltransferase [Patescibacteria group bacterium]